MCRCIHWTWTQSTTKHLLFCSCFSFFELKEFEVEPEEVQAGRSPGDPCKEGETTAPPSNLKVIHQIIKPI